MTKFRKGDVVSIEVTVASDYIHNDTTKVMAGGYNDFFIECAGMTMVRPVLKNGDMVWNRQLQHFGTILSIHGELLWVEADSGTFPTWLIGDVDRVDNSAPSDVIPGTAATSIIVDETMQPPSFPGAPNE
jgi:hypothetical protein